MPSFMTDATKHGATVLLGGGPLTSAEHKGYFIQPTVLSLPSPATTTTSSSTSDPSSASTSPSSANDTDTPLLMNREETFAPVLGLTRFQSEAQALSLANSSDVGLGSFVITQDIARSWRVAEALDVGMVGVNLGLLSAAESQFGGVKGSGVGTEGGRHGIEGAYTLVVGAGGSWGIVGFALALAPPSLVPVVSRVFGSFVPGCFSGSVTPFPQRCRPLLSPTSSIATGFSHLDQSR